MGKEKTYTLKDYRLVCRDVARILKHYHFVQPFSHAAQVGINASTLQSAIRRGAVPGVRLGHGWIFPAGAIQAAKAAGKLTQGRGTYKRKKKARKTRMVTTQAVILHPSGKSSAVKIIETADPTA